MRLTDVKPDLAELSHEYDPVKRHEYYLRNRKLKGRKKGSGTLVRPVVEAAREGLKGVKLRGAKPKGKSKARADAAARVAVLEHKIDKLKKELKKRLAEANDSAKESKPKKPTAADKADKARDSAKYRDKHKQELKTKAKKAAAKPDKPAPSGKAAKDQGVEGLKKTIDTLETKLVAAKARQRALG